VLLGLPWQATAVIGVAGFIAFRWIAPATFKGNVAVAFVPLFQMMAWLVLFAFALIAAVAFARSRSSVEAAGHRRHEPTLRQKTKASPDPIRSALDDTWREEIDAARARHSVPERISEPPVAAPTKWSSDVLRKMEWKQFELLAAAYYRALGFRPETIRCGADGGIDIKLFRGDSSEAISLVQCKAWTSRPVGVKPVRELLGVMVNEEVKTGVFLTTSTYTAEAVAFAEGNKVALVNGEQFLAKIRAMPAEMAAELLQVATTGDWTTPSCPSCGIKMVAREGKDRPFWGCANFPRCRQTFVMSNSEIPS
jgi:restriction system protein